MYQAIVTKLQNVRIHPNADRILLANCLGNQVVVGLDAREGDPVVYFNCDGQLSEEFCQANDLIGYKDPDTGERKGGFFDHRRRVRAQKFRQEISDGYSCPLSMFEFTGYDTSSLKEGDMFTELNGIPICNKYITKATREAGEKNKTKVKNRRETPMFPRHIETEQFRFFADQIPAGSLVSITLKTHGTSHRIAHVMDDMSPSIWERVKAFVTRKPFDRKDWTYLNGSRNVILEYSSGPGYYGSNDFRHEAVAPLMNNLRKGEIVYGEIVGWIDEKTPIMPAVNTESLKDKTFARTYGTQMIYKYGCPPGTRKFYVYRIAMATVDGHVIDLSWNAVKQRCAELGVSHVPEIVSPFVYDGDSESLRKLVEEHTTGEDLIDPSHIREGVCVRVENGMKLDIYKSKQHIFLVLEGVSKESDSYVDVEEST